MFTGVAYTFAFVGLRWVVAADFGSELADELLVDSFHLNLGIIRNGNSKTSGDGVQERVRTPEGKVEVCPIHSVSETDALDFEAFLKALGYACDHVVDDGASRAVEGTLHTIIFDGSADGDFVLFAVERDSSR